MTAILFSLMIVLQGIPVQQGGTVSGILRDSRGMPVAGVRMAAVARGDPLEKAGPMSGITETDTQGRFTLENIPPGRYVIAAGRLDLQTFYPGTQSLGDAAILTIARGTTISDINFVLRDSSFGRAMNDVSAVGLAAPIAAAIPVSIRVENGGKVPVTANGREISLTLASLTDQFTFPIDAAAIGVPGPLSADFSVRVDGLPPAYKIKSITYGATDITHGTFALSAANFSAAIRFITFTGPIAVSGVVNVSPPTTPPSPISITLEHAAAPKSAGVRVSGFTRAGDKPTVYISGVPGIVFSDRTFEFRDVPAGRHLIAAMHRFTPEAAVVVVGDKDVDRVELKRTLSAPDIGVPPTIAPAGRCAVKKTVA
jgi:hypothetical protein